MISSFGTASRSCSRFYSLHSPPWQISRTTLSSTTPPASSRAFQTSTPDLPLLPDPRPYSTPPLAAGRSSSSSSINNSNLRISPRDLSVQILQGTPSSTSNRHNGRNNSSSSNSTRHSSSPRTHRHRRAINHRLAPTVSSSSPRSTRPPPATHNYKCRRSTRAIHRSKPPATAINNSNSNSLNHPATLRSNNTNNNC